MSGHTVCHFITEETFLTIAFLPIELSQVERSSRMKQTPTCGPKMGREGGLPFHFLEIFASQIVVCGPAASAPPGNSLVQNLGSYFSPAELEYAFYQNSMNIHIQD